MDLVFSVRDTHWPAGRLCLSLDDCSCKHYDYRVGGVINIITSRLAIAVHILTLIGAERDTGSAMTSQFMAGSIGVHPVVVRNVTGVLRKAGLVQTQKGVSGVRLARPLSEMTLLDVYRAVEGGETLFSIHERPNPECPIGRNIQTTLETFFGEAQKAMEDRLARMTLQQIVQFNTNLKDE